MKPILDTERLRKIRESKGWSKNVASQEMGLLQSAYLRYENGVTSPSYSVMKIMAQTLGTTVDYLVGKTDDSSPSEYIISSKDARLGLIIETFQNSPEADKERLFKYAKRLGSSR